jgi:uncharacterized protein
VNCRKGCAACCTVISISSPLPGMPEGKPAGIACVNLDPEALSCTIWQTKEYPEVCRNFLATPEICGETNSEAYQNIFIMEQATATNT